MVDNEMKKIYIIGIGMGNADTMTIDALKKIKECQAIAGAQRMVESVLQMVDIAHSRVCYAVSSSEIFSWMKEQEDIKSFAVLMSGDTGFFSGSKKLAALIQQEHQYELELIPGISSLQYLCAKIQVPWENTKVVSLHGRKTDFLCEIQRHETVFFLTDQDCTPDYICRCLVQAGMAQAEVSVGERLSYPEEKITSDTAEALENQKFDSLNVVLVRNRAYREKRVVTHGIPDEAFIRKKIPMTKEEVRSVTISKLRICESDVVYDIGAGTGSVSVELALQAAKGNVYAIEAREEAVSLIEENRRKFDVHNLHVIHGMAPEAMKELPPADKAFIGGSKGNMAAIIKALLEKNPDIRISMNLIAIESFAEAIQGFRDGGIADIDVVQISVARAKATGNYHLMMGQNPVFILTGQKTRLQNG